MLKNTSKYKVIAGLLCFVFVVNFFLVQLAKAGLPVIDAPVATALAGILMQLKLMEVKPAIEKSIGASIGGGLLSGASYFLNRLAYDLSSWIAAGDYDERPLFLTDTNKYLKNTMWDSIGETIGFISQNSEFLKKYKVNLCVPPDIRMQLWLQLAMFDVYEPKPKCSWDSIKTAYARMAEPGYWQNIGIGFTAGQNDLSTLNSIYGFTAEESLRKRLEAKEDLELTGKSLSPKSSTTGDATTPTAMIDYTAAGLSPLGVALVETQQQTSDFVNALSLGNIGATFTNAGKLFVNNLASKAAAKLLQLGFISIFGGQEKLGLTSLDVGLENLDYQFSSGGGKSAAAVAFAGYLTVTITPENNYNYVGEMADCSGRNSALSCTIDSGLQTALSQAEVGAPVTIQEAMDKGMLHGDWLLYGPENVKNNDPQCANNAYCYSNLVKLRFWRILPVGFEFATTLRPTSPPTLATVVSNFNNNDINSPNYTFRHLIDPNWVLKAPTARCAAKGYGELLESGTNQRSQFCSDPQHCVNEDANGNCIGESNWGYCVREKNIWRLGGDACDAQYNTCTLYTNRLGKQGSYLANTVDRGVCAAQNAGCRGYSTTPKSDFVGWDPSSPEYYFNKSVETCDSGNEGCSRFVRTAGNVVGENLYLKKAPDYYNCYGEKNIGADALSGDAGVWPANKADLYKVFTSQSEKQKQECQRFANVCTAEETGCQLYKPVDDSASVPGIISVNDLCPSECAGYAKYVEAPLSMFSGTSPAYFINSTAKACQPANVGCSEFVNLDSSAGGGEQKQYFSQLRLCDKDANAGAVFYTWEGSDTAGYQLKSYNLKKAGDNTPDSFPSSSSYESTCGAGVFKTLAADPDCREFYDKNGTKSYRLYSKTITVDPTNCQTYRLSNVTKDACLAMVPGEWDNARGCLYNTITAESRVCPATQNNCRAYRGNTGNNYQTISTNNYEDKKPGQSDGDGNQYSAESLSQGGVSLKVITNAMESSTEQFESGQYVITFWAKGNKGDLTVKIYPQDSTKGTEPPPQTVTLGTDWATYSVGPFIVDWTATPANKTIFTVSNSAGLFFFDNYAIKKMTENVYVIKDSWVTPSSCDNLLDLDDDYGVSQGWSDANPLRLLPQAQLGCANYTDTNKNKVAVKSFTSMCREEAVGCEKVLDTFNVGSNNTTTAAPTFVNVICQLSATNDSNQAVPCLDKDSAERCLVQPGQNSCRFNFTGDVGANYQNLTGGKTIDALGANYNTVIFGAVAQGTITLSSAKEVYLVNNERSRCDTQNLGCQAFGLVDYKADGTLTADKTVYLKNQPDKYSDTFCTAEAERCEEFKNSKGGSEYFKDPAINQAKLCEWKKDAFTSPVVGSGWVKKSDSSACYSVVRAQPTSYNYRIWSAGSQKYNQMVGLCPLAQDTCSEFVDPEKTSPTNPLGEPYFVLNNNKLDRSSCTGASKKLGCILFNETGKGGVTWNAADTYGQNSDPANPVSNANNANNDSNLILKVKRDRQCGEWLSCSSYGQPFFDANGQTRRLCLKLGRCNAPASAGVSLENSCGNVLSSGYYGDKERLTDQLYKGRGIQWKDLDFDGYSLPNAYNLNELNMLNVSETADPDWRLVKRIPCGAGSNCVISNPPIQDSPACKTDGEACGVAGSGICKKSSCVQTPYGAKGITTLQANESSPTLACRNYPEVNSPFPNFDKTVASQVYSSVDFCQQDSNAGANSATRYLSVVIAANPTNNLTDYSKSLACDCSYDKQVYSGGITKYLDYNGNPPKGKVGVCESGAMAGMWCAADSDCNIFTGTDAVKCRKDFTDSKVRGKQGVCVQYDVSKSLYGYKDLHPCVTWLPQEQLSGMVDINSQFRDAGYDPSVANYSLQGPFYCTDKERWEYRPPTGYPVTASGLMNCYASGEGYYGEGGIPDDIKSILANYPNHDSNLLFNYVMACNPDDYKAFAEPHAGCCAIPGSEDNKKLPIPSSVCAPGYEAKGLEITGGTNGGDGDDTIVYKVTCKPTTPGWQLNGDDFKDRNETYHILSCDERVVLGEFPSGGFCFPHRGIGKLFTVQNELDEYRCTSLFQAGKDGETKAKTQIMWEEGKLPANDSCEPDPASSLNVDPEAKKTTVLLDGQGGTVEYAGSCEVGKYLPFATIPSYGYTGDDGTPLPPTDGWVYHDDHNAIISIGSPITNPINSDKLSWPKKWFAKLYSWFYYDNATQKLVGVTSINTGNNDTRAEIGTGPNYNDLPKAPIIRAVGGYVDGKGYKEGADNQISIGDKPYDLKAGPPVLTSGDLVSISFFIKVSDNQMPVRQVAVYYDNKPTAEIYNPENSYFRNYRGLNDAGIENCVENGAKNKDTTPFGNIKDWTCESRPFSVEHTFECVAGRSENNWTTNYNLCPPDVISVFGGCCIYHPRAMVKDNWGWCTGDCRAGGGCYDELPDGGDDECKVDFDYWTFSGKTKAGPWVYYGGTNSDGSPKGRVIVVPALP